MITRYRPDVDEMERSAPMHEDKEGDYVAYEDYEEETDFLRAEIVVLKAELSRYIKGVGGGTVTVSRDVT